MKTERGDRFCDGIIISPNQILVYHCPNFYLDAPVSLFFRRRKVIENFYLAFEVWPSKTIKKPDWNHSVGIFHVLTLDKPLKSATEHAPICISGCVPKKYKTNHTYFGWVEKHYRDNDDTMYGVVHFSRIQKMRE